MFAYKNIGKVFEAIEVICDKKYRVKLRRRKPLRDSRFMMPTVRG